MNGTDLFISEEEQGAIGDYSLSDATWNPSFISGLDEPTALTLHGNDLFEANFGNGTIGQYTTSGDPVNPDLISGLGTVYSIAVVPEPAALGLLALAGSTILLSRRRSTV